jgi:hypothetical protein
MEIHGKSYFIQPLETENPTVLPFLGTFWVLNFT